MSSGAFKPFPLLRNDPRLLMVEPGPRREAPNPDCHSDVDADDDFEIEDEDLRKLYEERKDKRIVGHDRDLTNSTKAKQALTKERWESIWKCVRQIYLDTKFEVMDEDLGRDILNYINTELVEKLGLVKGNLYKPLMGHAALYGFIHYVWIYDTESFTHERERVQLVTVMLWLAFTGARPGGIVESGCDGIRGTNEAVRYKDVKLMVVHPKDSGASLAIELF